MAAGQPLRGLMAQNIGGAKKSPAQKEPTIYGRGTWSFVPALAGRYKFIAWGDGGAATSGSAGASAGYAEATVYLDPSRSTAIVVQGPDTTITFPNGRVVTAGAASTITPGTATGADLNIAGSVAGAAGSGTGGGPAGAAGATTGGAGAPGQLPYRGGMGGNGNDNQAAGQSGPGVGAGAGQPSSGVPGGGGPGQVIVVYLGG